MVRQNESVLLCEAGVSALRSCVQLIARRTENKTMYYTWIWNNIVCGAQTRSTEKTLRDLQRSQSAWLGSLLALGEVLDRNNGAAPFFHEKVSSAFDFVCSSASIELPHCIVTAVVRLIPILAAVRV